MALVYEEETRVAIEEHRQLLNKLLVNEIENNRIESYRWNNNWSEESKLIIMQDMIERKLFRRHKYYSQFIEYVAVHQTHPLSYLVFQESLLELIKYLKKDMFTVDETKMFWEFIKTCLQSCFESIKMMRTLFPEMHDLKIQVSAILG